MADHGRPKLSDIRGATSIFDAFIFDVQCGVNLACVNILDGNSQKYFPGTAHWRIKVGYTALKDLG